MDIAIIYEKIGAVLVQIWALEFTFAGITTTTGAVVLWSAVASLVIWFLRGLAD